MFDRRRRDQIAAAQEGFWTWQTTLRDLRSASCDRKINRQSITAMSGKGLLQERIHSTALFYTFYV